MQSQSVRIVAADDHPIFRDGLCRLLAGQPDFEVVGQTGSGREVPKLVAELSPDVLLLDLRMPDLSGLDVLRQLELPRSKVRAILLTAAAENHQVLEALRLGARGLVLKESTSSMLFKCIRGVMEGDYWFGHDQMPNLVEAFRRLSSPEPRSPAETLTTRELRIIAAIVEGGTNRDLSKQFGLSEQTVKNHLSHIFDKLGVSNRLELALYAIHHKLLERAPLLWLVAVLTAT